MGLRAMHIRSFKCFADTGRCPLAPLTVIVGRNSSGKSSLIQPLLLLKQTTESQNFGNTINLREPLYDAGSFGDIVHLHRRDGVIDLTFELDLDPSSDETRSQGMTPWLVFRDLLEEVGPIRATVRLIISRAEFSGARLDEIRILFEGSPEVVIAYVPAEKKPLEGEWRLQHPQTRRWAAVQGYGPRGESIFPLILAADPRVDADTVTRPRLRVTPEVAPCNMILNFLEDFFRSLHFLGPFRTSPQRRYDFAGKDFQDVGLDGKYAVQALIADNLRDKTRAINTIREWFEGSGLADGFNVSRVGPPESSSFEITFTSRGTSVNYTDVGFGISQVLPVLVQGLRTPKYGTFVCQQPEIHLHPDAQVALAAFFVELVHGKRRVIIETHSEHLVLGIRRILSDERTRRPARLKPRDVSLLYVDDTDPTTSVVRALEIDENMGIRNWPAGFMEEAERERLHIIQNALVPETSQEG